MSKKIETDVLIVGAGLAGLSLATRLNAENIDYRVIEARNRLGGRIETEFKYGGYFDLGPSWFWQGQTRILSLIRDLEMDIFEQYATGDLTYEDERGNVQRGVGISSMQGSLRLAGGLRSLIDKLASKLPQSRILMNTALLKLTETPNDLRSIVSADSDAMTIVAKRVVLAIPPRIALENVQFEPALPIETIQAMSNIPTWMAGQAKALAIYKTPFWRDAGLSGDAMSRRGPMVEIHDASPNDEGPFALFGFIGISASDRKDEQGLKTAVLNQLCRLFGDLAKFPEEILIKDWAFEMETATHLDHAPILTHPQYGLHHTMTGLMNGKMLFGSTEVAKQFGGYLEGALEAAESVAKAIKK